jgi:hypothetical protein
VAEPDIDATRRAFGEQHRDDGARRAVAEQLSERLLVIGDAMPLDQRDEVVLRVTVERRLVEMRIGRDEPVRLAVEVGEVAAPAAGDEDFRARLVEMIEQQHFEPALSRGECAHQPGGAGADHDRVEGLAHRVPALSISRCFSARVSRLMRASSTEAAERVAKWT